MFGNKISEKEYNEMVEKYQIFEASYKNEQIRSERLQRELDDLKAHGFTESDKNEIAKLRNMISEKDKQIKVLEEKYIIFKNDLLDEQKRSENFRQEINTLKSKSSSNDAGNEIEKLKSMIAEKDAEIKTLSAKANKSSDSSGIAVLQTNIKTQELMIEQLSNQINQLSIALENNGGNRMAETTQWEYKNIAFLEREKSETELNQLGKEGWELSGTFSNDMAKGTIILKRPKQKQVSKDYDYGYSR